MIRKVGLPKDGGGSSGFVDKVREHKSSVAIAAVIVVIIFAVAFFN